MTPLIEKQMEKNMDYEMGTRAYMLNEGPSFCLVATRSRVLAPIFIYGGCPIFFLPKTTLSPPFRGPFAGFRPQHFL